jgi:hypothetical protein
MAKAIIVVGCLLLALNFIMVPYTGNGQHLGYGTIFTPVQYQLVPGSKTWHDGDIDYHRIKLQSGAIVLISFAALLLTPEARQWLTRPRSDERDPPVP